MQHSGSHFRITLHVLVIVLHSEHIIHLFVVLNSLDQCPFVVVDLKVVTCLIANNIVWNELKLL